jgi:hypothetical protein
VSQKIPWKTVPIETIASDGTPLRGNVTYWAKDYSVQLEEPFEASRYGAHLMYMIPQSFIVDTDNEEYHIEKCGRHYLNLYAKSKKILQELYEEKS